MRKLLLMSLIFLLIGCSLSKEYKGKTAEEWSNEYNILEIKIKDLESNLKKSDTNSMFEKNKDCFSFKSKVEDYWKDSIKTGAHIESIFFSLKANSCLYVYRGGLPEEGRISFNYLANVFTNDIIAQFIDVSSDFNTKEWNEFQDIILEYKDN